MKAQITFKQQNPDFDKGYAEQYCHGGESDGNRKDNWSFTMGIDGDVAEISIKENSSVVLAGGEISKVTIFEYKIVTGEVCQFVVSDSLINKVHKAGNSKYRSSHLYVYFKDTDDYYIHRTNGQLMYFACENFPQELLKYIAAKEK